MDTLVFVLMVVGGLGVAVWFVLGRKYRRLLDDRHLFGELPDVLAVQKTAAFSLIGRPVESRDDPRLRMTSAGLAMGYTAERIGEDIFNHLSFSYRGGPVALAFGARCGFFLLTFLGVDPTGAVLAHSQRGMIHLGFLLKPDEVRDFEARALDVPPPDRVEELRASAEAWRDGLLTRQLVLRDEGDLLPRLLNNATGQD